MANDETHINPENATTGSPVEGACCFTNFAASPTLPTSASAALGEGWVNLGEISGNGYTEKTSLSTTTHKGWHGTPLMVTDDGTEKSFSTEFVEVYRPSVAKLRYGVDNVTESSGSLTKIEEGAVPDSIVPLVFDELLADGRLSRTVFPRARIESIDDVAHRRGDMLVYGMTFKALADSNNHTKYQYFATPEVSGNN